MAIGASAGPRRSMLFAGGAARARSRAYCAARSRFFADITSEARRPKGGRPAPCLPAISRSMNSSRLPEMSAWMTGWLGSWVCT